jgi:orotidine-5'-phosphate decarboxylase
MNPQERILVALDVDSVDDALRLTRLLAGKVGGFKVGLELVNAVGFDIFTQLQDAGAERIFYDAKFHDIPNTVAGAVRAAAKRGVWMVNVHASGGTAMLQAAREVAQSAEVPPLLIAVTVLTSIDDTTLNQDLRTPGTVAEQVAHLAQVSESAGVDGVVASPQEVALIRQVCQPSFLTVIPGIRPAGVAAHDQKRIATPQAAVEAGADYLVIGRAITQSPDPAHAVATIVHELSF